MIDCKAFADSIEHDCALFTKHKRVKLIIITTIYADDASKVYMRNKLRAADRCGILCEVITCSSFDEIMNSIERYNYDDNVDGIIVQLPLPLDYSVATIQRAILPSKDVDGFHPNSLFHPCTPEGVVRLLDYYKYPLDGSICTVIGRSDIVGKPLSSLLLKQNATVINCHSHTSSAQLKTLTAYSDYVFCAAGVPNLINIDNVNSNAIYIDISINRDNENHLCGDLSAEARQYCKDYTPVPKGIGPITVAELMRHTCVASTF